MQNFNCHDLNNMLTEDYIVYDLLLPPEKSDLEPEFKFLTPDQFVALQAGLAWRKIIDEEEIGLSDTFDYGHDFQYIDGVVYDNDWEEYFSVFTMPDTATAIELRNAINVSLSWNGFGYREMAVLENLDLLNCNKADGTFKFYGKKKAGEFVGKIEDGKLVVVG